MCPDSRGVLIHGDAALIQGGSSARDIVENGRDFLGPDERGRVGVVMFHVFHRRVDDFVDATDHAVGIATTEAVEVSSVESASPS